MKRYFLFRILEMPNTREEIPIDYMPELSDDGDEYLVFIAKELHGIGVYEKKGETLIAKKVFETPIDFREYYEKFSFIDFVGERTYKIFAKKMREINKEDIELFL